VKFLYKDPFDTDFMNKESVEYLSSLLGKPVEARSHSGYRTKGTLGTSDLAFNAEPASGGFVVRRMLGNEESGHIIFPCYVISHAGKEFILE
jgi:hypothetical protein